MQPILGLHFSLVVLVGVDLLVPHCGLICVSLIGNYIELFIAYLPWNILFCELTTVHSCVN